jgi:hypothetical protein
MRSHRLTIPAAVLTAILCLPSIVLGQAGRACNGSDDSFEACPSRPLGDSLQPVLLGWRAHRLPILIHRPLFARSGGNWNLHAYALPPTNYSPAFASSESLQPSTTADHWKVGSGNWGTAADWTAGVPTGTSAVTIGNTSDGFVTENLAKASAASLSILSGNGLRVDAGNLLTVGGATTVASGGELLVDDNDAGGSTLSSGSLTNAGFFQIGNGSMTAASTAKVAGTLNNTGGTIYVEGGEASGANALLSVSGAAPATLTGSYELYGSSGSAAVEFGSGGITSIGDGSTNSGYVRLDGTNAYLEVGATNSNSALTGLKTIASNGELELENGAVVTTTGALNNAGKLGIDYDGNGGSSMSIGGSLTNSGTLLVGNDDAFGSTMKIGGPSLTNTGSINLSGGSGVAELEINAPKVTVSGAGTINLSNIASNVISGASATDTLINSGNTIQGSGSIADIGLINSGTILADQSTPLVIAPSSLGLNNQGTLGVNAGSTLQITGTNGGSLLNFSGTTLTGGTYMVGGTLQFGASGSSIVTNAANITLLGAGSQIIDLSGGNVLANFATNAATGSFTITGGRSFTTKGNFTNNGSLEVDSGSTFVVNGNLTNLSGTTLTGGTYNVGGTLQFNGAGVVTDAANISLTTSSAQIISQNGANALTNLAAISSAGSLSLSGGANFTTAGNFTNNGNLTVASGSNFVVNGNLSNLLGTTLLGGTYNIGGSLQFNGANIVIDAANISLTSNSAQIVNQTGGNALANLATIAGGSFSLSGGASFTTAGKFNNAGMLNIGNGSNFVVNGNLANLSGTTLTGGVYSIAGTLQFNGANIVTNAANVTLDGSSAQIIDENENNGLANLAANTSAGKFTLAGAKNLSVSGPTFSNAGVFTIGAGSTFTVGNGGSSDNAVAYSQSGGTTTVDGTLASASTTSGAQLNLDGGALFGTGTIGSKTQLFAVSDASTITPGNSATTTGKLTIDGTYAQAANGTLDISIAGSKAGAQYDQLDASSSVSLASGSTLNVQLLDRFVPAIGTTFDILNAASLSGTFTKVNGLAINSSEHFSVSYKGDEVILTVVSGAVSSSKNPLATSLRWPASDGSPRIGYIPFRHFFQGTPAAPFVSGNGRINTEGFCAASISASRGFIPSLASLGKLRVFGPDAPATAMKDVGPTLTPVVQVWHSVVPILSPPAQSGNMGGSLIGASTQATFLISSALRPGLGPVPVSASAQLAFHPAMRRSEFAIPNRNQTIASQIGLTQVVSFSGPNYRALLSDNSVAANRMPIEPFSMGRIPSAAPRNSPAAKNIAYHFEVMSIFGANRKHFLNQLLNSEGNQFGYLTIR